MSWLAVATIGAGTLSAGGNIGGALISKPKNTGISLRDTQRLRQEAIDQAALTSALPFTNTLLGGAGFEALLQLGNPNALDSLRFTSPIDVAISRVTGTGLFRRDVGQRLAEVLGIMKNAIAGGANMEEAIKAIEEETGFVGVRDILNQVRRVGIDPEDLAKRQADFNARLATAEQQGGPIAERVAQSRLSLLNQLADIQGDFGDFVNETTTDAKRRALEAANARGINPEKLFPRISLEGIEQAGALIQAIQSLLSGPTQLAAGIGSQTEDANLTAASIAAQQAAAFNNLNLGAVGAGASGPNPLGQGIASGTNSLANSISFNALLNQGQPGDDGFLDILRNLPSGTFSDI